jgi:16S rRNA (cytosine1402-N4)-methyltransferase
MNPEQGGRTAGDLVSSASHEELKRIIREYGEEPMAGRIASRIVKVREERSIEGTQELAGLVARAYPAKRRAKSRHHPATKTFQALRMAVNQELEELSRVLGIVPQVLNPGGRMVVIAFHSLEDRLVKQALKREAAHCVCPPHQDLCTCDHRPGMRILTKKPLRPSPEEVHSNPRSRSARLRAAEALERR